jgi:hypothetical protein
MSKKRSATLPDTFVETDRSALLLKGLLRDFQLLIILFIAFRLMLLIVYQPIVTQGIERGLGAGGDQTYYFDLAALSGQGLLPFRDWWSEFPPIWSFMTVIVYQFLGANANYTGYSMFMGLIMLAFDVGNLILLRNIGARLHGANTGMTLAWIYAVTLAPMVFLWWTFETMVAFFLLLGLWWLLNKQETRSAIAIAIGTLIKFTPALIAATVWRFRDWRAALRFTLIVVGLFVLVYVPLVAQQKDMALASLTAQFGKASYQTVWALLDGNYRTGIFGSVQDHLDPALATDIRGNPAVIPGVIRLAIAGAIGVFVFVRTRRFDDKGLVAFVGITLLIFFLQAQGWSPQWLVQIIPLVLLSFPTRNGVLIVIMLSLATFTEYPMLFIRTGDSGGEITGALVTPFVMLVLARTVLLIGLCVALYRRLLEEPIV